MATDRNKRNTQELDNVLRAGIEFMLSKATIYHDKSYQETRGDGAAFALRKAAKSHLARVHCVEAMAGSIDLEVDGPNRTIVPSNHV